MSTRKIIDAKQNGEKVWLKGHAQAIYMSDGSTVEDAINDIKINGSGNIDLFDYETKVESQNKLQEAKDYTDTAIANLVDSAPETLNTLNELAEAIQENEDVVDVLNQSIDSKQDTIIDLDTIRQGAAKGATALQSYTEQYKGTIQAVDTFETLDDVETNTYVEYIAQTLTEEQKEQARNNIGINLTDYVKKSNLSNVATSGSYNDLTNKPTILSESDVNNLIDTKIGDINSILENIINRN